MSTQIHPTAIIHDGAELGTNVVVGPYCIIGSNAKVGDNSVLKSHVVIDGHTTIGMSNEIWQFTSLGTPPQDKSYKNEPTELIIGDNNIFREGINIHRATTKQDHKTIIGSNNYFMSAVHIAHDCVIGNFVTLASGCACAGHVTLGDYVQMGGQCGVTPFVTIGKGGFIGGASAVDRDIPHFCAAFGNRIRLKGVNIIGLKRRGFSKDLISEVIDFYRVMEASALSPKAFVEHKENLVEYANNDIIKEIVDFISKSEIGISPFMN